MASTIEVEHKRRLAVITPRAGKFKLEYYLTFEDGTRENVGGGLEYSEPAAIKRAESWTRDGR